VRHEPEMLIATKYLLIGMLACIVLAALTACSDSGDSKTGYATALPEYPEIEAARSRLRLHYPEAADYPTMMSERWSHAYGVYYDGMIYLSQLWLDKNAKEPVWGACLILHEYNHSIGIGHDAAMDRSMRECHSKIT